MLGAVTDRPPRATDHPDGVVVLSGADLTIADVEAVARRRGSRRPRRGRPGPDGGGPRRRRAARGRGRGRVRDHDGVRRPGDDVHPAGRCAAAPGEPPREPCRGGRARRCRATSCGRCSSCARTRWRSATRAAGPLVVDRLLRFLELGIHPVVPAQGSVGASGDLAPLAHLALPLIGRGEVELGGHVMPALLALREEGLDPLVLEAKEGLALLNGTQLMSGIGALLLADADRLARTASVAAAQSVEALLGTDVAYAAAYQLARPHPGQVAVAGEMRHLLRDSGLMAHHHASTHKVQDPYSLRCVPAGPRRGPGRPRPPSARARRRDERGDRQPARLPAGRRGRRGRGRDRRRAGHLRRQLPRRADRARARLREARRWPSWGRSASAGSRCSWITGSTGGCRPSSPRRAASTPG